MKLMDYVIIFFVVILAMITGNSVRAGVKKAGKILKSKIEEATKETVKVQAQSSTPEPSVKK
jgi:hypothetical protein